MRARILILAFLVVAATQLGASDLWIHVRVTDSGHRPTSVEINLPLRLVERIAPILDEQKDGDAEIRLGHSDLDVYELRDNWGRLKAGEVLIEDDAIMELMDGPNGQVLSVRERDGDGTNAKLPADVIEALLSGRRDRLDLDAAVKALARHGEGELVTAMDDESIVRIWLDYEPEPTN